jgi:predicted amidohydrolase
LLYSDTVPPHADHQPVRIAAAQLSLQIADLAANRAAAAAAIAAAAGLGARIIVLPELTPSGYVFGDPAEARSLSEPADGPTARGWAALAAEHDVVIIGGFAELGDDGTLYNSAMLVDRSGPRAVYRKAHLWDAEADFFATGAEPPPVIDTAFGRIAMMICYDVEFPEWVRLPALAGAELLAVPTNWPAEPVPAGERPMVTVNVQVAAFANRMFVAAACRCGDERGVSWVGGSIIAGPDGYPLAGPASVGDETGRPDPASLELLIADCDLRLARDKATSPRNDMHADRRPELYGPVARPR